MSAPADSVRILFVCLGNICRSPTAEGVMRALVEREGMQARVELDSAGTGSWHVGNPPDSRASAAAAERGVTLTSRARRVAKDDFFNFDLIVAMDESNAADLRALAPDVEARDKVRLLREFDRAGRSETRDGSLDVPDPYYGGEDGFGEVFELVQAACEGLLEEIREGRVR